MNTVMSAGDEALWADALPLLREAAGHGHRKEVVGFLLGWYFFGGPELELVMGQDEFEDMVARCRSSGLEPTRLGCGRFLVGPRGEGASRVMCCSVGGVSGAL